MHDLELIQSDIDRYLDQHERKDLLRLLTCGSVDDGKSTLIGRLLHDAHAVHEDTLAAATRDSTTLGTQQGALDLALLVDGLKAEREQGITIDVAYRSFTTARRRFIIADTPGHEQFTRNMATGASTAELAVILIDARTGVVKQTRRHAVITHLLGIRQVVVAVNKMDLVAFDEARFTEICGQFEEFFSRLHARFGHAREITTVHFVPMVATDGDSVVDRSSRMPWYQGKPLLEILESAPLRARLEDAPLRLSVQWVNRPNLDFRGYAGRVASGVVAVGDSLLALPSRRTTSVARIVTMDGDLSVAQSPLAITITLSNEIDLARGDMLVHAHAEPTISNAFHATCVWMDDASMLVSGKEYLLKHGVHTVRATVTRVLSRLDLETLDANAATTLAFNEIGAITMESDQPLIFDSYDENRDTGAAILIDRLTNQTAGALMLRSRRDAPTNWNAPPKSGEMSVQPSTVTAAERRTRLGAAPLTVLFFGGRGAGKSRLARAVERALFDIGQTSIVLDGHEMRQGLSRDLGFSRVDRSENVRRAMEVAKTLNQAGLLVLAAFSAPDAGVREAARALISEAQFVGVFVGGGSSAAGDDACDPPSKDDLTLSSMHASDETTLAKAVQEVLTTLARRASR